MLASFVLVITTFTLSSSDAFIFSQRHSSSFRRRRRRNIPVPPPYYNQAQKRSIPSQIFCNLDDASISRQHLPETEPSTSSSEPSTSSSSPTITAKNNNKNVLPDYGKTTVQVDTIRLEKKSTMQRNKNNNNNSMMQDVSEAWRRHDLFGSSIIDQTLLELQDDIQYQETQMRLGTMGLEGMSKEERTQRRRALDKLGIAPFAKFLHTQTGGRMPKRKLPTVLQINIGLYCNQACAHCHVESSPLRKEEMMTAGTAAQCLHLLKNTPSITTLDITGGAPELNPHFRYLVRMARALRPDDLRIMDRCNLTVLQEPGQADLIEFLKQHQVHIIASLPCYSAENVNTQRGNGVFERSIAALIALNDAGYGRDTNLPLDLVYNPLGGFLPPPQEKLEAQYKQQLADNFGIVFHKLFTITNMPIKRFADFLHRRGELEEYMELLIRNFNPDTVPQLMCLDTISVGWDGRIYDCDFNQQLGYAVGVNATPKKGDKTVFDIESLTDLMQVRIRTDNHCFGCTAGMGSS